MFVTVIDREDDHRPGVVNDLAVGSHSTGLKYFIGCNRERRPVVNLARGEESGFAAASFAAGRFGHTDNIKQAAWGIRV